MEDGISKKLADHPDARECFKVKYQPNPKNLFQRIKEKLRKPGYISVSRNYIRLETVGSKKLTHEEFIAAIQSIDVSRKLVIR